MIKLLKIYIKFHLFFIKKIFFEIILRLDKYLFCYFYNIFYKLKKSDNFFSFDKQNNLYKASNQEYNRYFYPKKRGLTSYAIEGIAKRGKSLGKYYLLDKIQFNDDDNIVDCGANLGDLEIYFKENKKNINYIAFEPSPIEFKCLKKNLILKNSKCFNYGLFDKEEELKFYISSEDGDSSFFEPPSHTKIINVKSIRLDSIYKNLEIDIIKLLKLEAEGAEPEILYGCKNILSKIEYISADVGFERGIKKESTLPQVNKFLLENRFRLIEISRDRMICLFKNENIKF